MNTISNLWRLAAIGALSLCLSVPASRAFAEEELPGGPKPEGEEPLPGSEEEANEEEDVDVLGTLDKIIGKMKDAEASLAEAGTWKATDAQGNAIEEAEKLLTAKDLQDKAIREMNKIFDGSKDGQSQAIEGIEKLIKAAKESQGNQQGNQKQKQKQNQQKQPNQQNPKNPNNPATKPYNPSGNADDGNARERTGELPDKWGNLPDKLRDEISQADDEFRSIKGTYGDRLREYTRMLGSSE